GRRRRRRRNAAAGGGVPTCSLRPGEAGDVRRARSRCRRAPDLVGARTAPDRRRRDQRDVVGPQPEGDEVSRGRGLVGTRVGNIRDWLAKQTNSWVGRLSFLWFKRYMEASKNSGASTTAYFMLSMFPTFLVAIAIFSLTGGDANALAE